MSTTFRRTRFRWNISFKMEMVLSYRFSNYPVSYQMLYIPLWNISGLSQEAWHGNLDNKYGYWPCWQCFSLMRDSKKILLINHCRLVMIPRVRECWSISSRITTCSWCPIQCVLSLPVYIITTTICCVMATILVRRSWAVIHWPTLTCRHQGWPSWT